MGLMGAGGLTFGGIFAVLGAGSVHFFADAALLQEILLEAVDESAQQDVFLMDEGDGDVGNIGVVSAGNRFAV